jgi:hypothetical protein
MKDNKDTEIIDLKLIIKKIFENKVLFLKVLAITFILSSLYIICIPRYYTTQTKLAPEIETPMNSGGLSSIASSFGFDLTKMQTTDAITPMLYPNLLEDNKFISDLFYIKVVSEDGKVQASYYDYLNKKQKNPWWNNVIGGISHIFTKGKKDNSEKKEIDPYRLTEEQSKIASIIKNNIKLNVDSKDGVITITTTAQDPLICKTLADSTRTKLQSFITTYRTNKARTDFEYYKRLASEAKLEYEKSRQLYGSYADANVDIILESFKSKQEDLENDMQLKFNNYTTLNNQLQMARAKVQERTPAFTILQGASVPERPAGPKRMIFVFVMLLLSSICFVLIILRKDFAKIFA